MKVSILTLGCRVNQSESQVIEGTLRENGVDIVNIKENPDYCIINTCSVTSKSDYNSRQLIRRAARMGAKVIVTGCYSQLRPDQVYAIPGVSKLIDIQKKHEIVEIITNGSNELFFGNYSRSRPFLKVQDGCNYHCSYCTVPFARGKSKSIPQEIAIERAQLIESSGYREIVLTGIHLGSYGHDLGKKSNIASLLKTILLKTKEIRIRLSSLEINEIDDELIDIMSEDRVCKHIHLPMQSGSDNILLLMRRSYSAEYYSKMINKIASTIDNICIGTDVIVGFPGETINDFMLTHSLGKGLPFSYFHIFPYSVRIGTDAASMIMKEPRDVVMRWADMMQELNIIKKHAFMVKQIGKKLQVIIEQQICEDSYNGTSGNYQKIEIRAKGLKKGCILDVLPKRLNGDILEADLAL